MRNLTYTIHAKEQQALRSITDKMLRAVINKCQRPYVQFTQDYQIEHVHYLNWNGLGKLMVVTNDTDDIIITVKWERFSDNWKAYDRSEDYERYKYRIAI